MVGRRNCRGGVTWSWEGWMINGWDMEEAKGTG